MRCNNHKSNEQSLWRDLGATACSSFRIAKCVCIRTSSHTLDENRCTHSGFFCEILWNYCSFRMAELESKKISFHRSSDLMNLPVMYLTICIQNMYMGACVSRCLHFIHSVYFTWFVLFEVLEIARAVASAGVTLTSIVFRHRMWANTKTWQVYCRSS